MAKKAQIIDEETKLSKVDEFSNLVYQYENRKSKPLTWDEPSEETVNGWKRIIEFLSIPAVTIDSSIYEAFLAEPQKYIVTEDNKIILNENYDAEQAAKEQERIAKLHMTKYDFFKYVLEPNGITFANLQEVLQTNDALNAAFSLCNHVYRGDETLNQFIFAQIPSLTAEALTAIFEEHHAE